MKVCKIVFVLRLAADSEILTYILAAPVCVVVLSVIDGEKM